MTILFSFNRMNIYCASENSDADVISSNSCPISRPKMSNFFQLNNNKQVIPIFSNNLRRSF